MCKQSLVLSAILATVVSAAKPPDDAGQEKIWLERSLQPRWSQTLKVLGAAHECNASQILVGEYKNPLLKTEFISGLPASVTLGPFQDTVGNCGAKEFQLIGSCLTLDSATDQTVTLILMDPENSSCTRAGSFEGLLNIKLKEHPQVTYDLNFDYLLTCQANLTLEGAQTDNLSYVEGGPDLMFNVGTWVQFPNCGYNLTISSNVSDESWINFSQKDGLVTVRGLPEFSGDFNFEVTATLDDYKQTSNSFIWPITFEEGTGTFGEARRLWDCTSCGAQMCWNFDNVQPYITYVLGDPDVSWTPNITTIPAGCPYTVQSSTIEFFRNACKLSPVDTCNFYDLADDGRTIILRQNNSFNPNYTELDMYYLTINGLPKFNKATKFNIKAQCTTTITAPTLTNQILQQSSSTVVTIPAFSNAPACSDTKTCTSSSVNVVWNQSDQEFKVQSLGASDVLGLQTVTLRCRMTSYASIPQVSASFDLTITPLCSTNTIITPDLTDKNPITIINMTYDIQTIGSAFKDQISIDYGNGTGVDLCGARNCRVLTNNLGLYYRYVFYDDTTKLFTAKSNYDMTFVPGTSYAKRTGTDIVTLECRLWSYSSVPVATVSLTVNIISCTFSAVTPTGITQGQVLSYSLLDPATSYEITYVTSPSCSLTYVVNMQMQDGSSDLSVFGGTFSGSKLTIFNLNASAQVGTFNVRWFLTTTDNPDQPLIYINFTVVISPCVVISATQTGDQWVLASTVNIFSTGITKTFGSFTQTPSCNLTPFYTLQVQENGVWSPAPQFFTYSALSWTIKTSDSTLGGQVKNVRFAATFGSYVFYKPSMAVTFVDPCVLTSLIAPAAAIQNQVYFLSGSKIAVNLPWLNDIVNVNQGTSSTQSICSPQTVLVKESGQVATFGSVSLDTDGQTIYTVQTSDEFHAGGHLLTAEFSLPRYPAVAAYQSTFSLTIYQVTTPKVADRIFKLDSPAMTFEVENFLLSPSSSTILRSYRVTLLDGNPLPNFITQKMTDTGFEFKVSTTSELDIASYSLKIVGTFILGSLSFEKLVNFQVIVQSAPKNQPPYFLEPLGGPYILKVGQDWKLKLPEYADPEGKPVTVYVDLDKAGVFMIYQDFSLAMFRKTYSSEVGDYTIFVNLIDTKGAQSKNKISLTIKEDPPQVQVEVPNERVQEIIDKLASRSFDFASDPNSNWDWLAQYLKALESAKKLNSQIVPIKPTAVIKQISILGVVEIKFSKQMTTPPLEQFKLIAQPFNQNTTTIEQNTIQWQRKLKGTSPFALQLEVIPGDPERASNLTFSYNITEYKNTTMLVQLQFEFAAFVAAFSERDYLQIRFPANFYIFDTEGQFLEDPEVVLQYALPSQLQFNSTETKLVTSVTDTAESFTTAAMVSNTVVNLLLSAALNQLFSMVEAQQIIILMALFNIRMPANAAMFFGFMMQIASFDFIPMHLLYDMIFPAQIQTSALNPNFDQIGFSSMYLIYNLGSMILAFFLIPVKILLYFCLKPFNFYERVRKIRHQLWVSTFWNDTIKTIVESFTIMVICVLINFHYFNFEDPNQDVNSILSIAFGFTFLSFPIISTALLLAKFDQLQTKYAHERFGSLYEGLNLQSGKPIIAHIAFYFIRRILIPVSVIYNDYLIIQVMVMAYSIIAHVIIVQTVKPLEGGAFAYKIEMFHEVIMMQILYTMLCFTDFVPDVTTRGYIGYYSMAMVCLHLGVCFFFMLKSSYKGVVKRIKVYFFERRQEQMLQKVMSLRLAREQVKVTLHRSTIIQELVQTELRMDIIEEVSQVNEESKDRSSYYTYSSSFEVQIEPSPRQAIQTPRSEIKVTSREVVIDITAEPNLDQLIEEIDKMVFFVDQQKSSVIPPNEDNVFEDYMNQIVEEEHRKQGNTEIVQVSDDEPQIPIFPDQGPSYVGQKEQQSKSSEVVERKPKQAKQKLSFDF